MRTRVTFPVLMFTVGLLLPATGSAQGAGRWTTRFSPQASALWTTTVVALPIDDRGSLPRLRPAADTGGAPTHWLEGGLLGAALGGAVGYFGAKGVANGLCTGSDAGMCNDYNVQIGVGGAVLGFLIGTAIGNHHPKGGEPVSPSAD